MWTYNGQPYEPSKEELEISPFVGFVYQITEVDTGMKYIGKKFFWRKVTKPPLKGRKNKRRSIAESDWKSYYGSNDKIKDMVESGNQDRFKREILMLCVSKGECSYQEAKLQFDNEVLLRDDYYNGIISCRINASHVRSMRNKQLTSTDT